MTKVVWTMRQGGQVGRAEKCELGGVQQRVGAVPVSHCRSRRHIVGTKRWSPFAAKHAKLRTTHDTCFSHSEQTLSLYDCMSLKPQDPLSNHTCLLGRYISDDHHAVYAQAYMSHCSHIRRAVVCFQNQRCCAKRFTFDGPWCFNPQL